MKFLLPNRFKSIGAVAAPLGFTLWVAMQRGLVTDLLAWFFRERTIAYDMLYRNVNIAVAVISFFGFLAGLYFLAFSKEKIEDEMIQRTRMASFQFAALVQLITIITGFVAMVLYREPGAEGMMMFFIVVTFIFWLSFIGRFNSTLYFRKRQNEKFS